MVAVLGSVAIVWLNRDFYRFLGRCRGPGFALAALPLHLVYFTCCGLAVLFALFQWHIVNRVTFEGSAGAARASVWTRAPGQFRNHFWLGSHGGWHVGQHDQGSRGS